MTVADTNVRPAWRSPAVSARGTRRFGLARLLLKDFGRLLRKLDLTFLVLLAVAPTPACIIPVGPDWRDPFGAPNAEPQILNPDPFPGSEVTGMTGDPRTFTVFVTDPNIEDTLALGKELILNHEGELSRLVEAVVEAGRIGDQFADAGIPIDSPM